MIACSRETATRAASRAKSGCIDAWYAAVSAISSVICASEIDSAGKPEVTFSASASGSTDGSSPWQSERNCAAMKPEMDGAASAGDDDGPATGMVGACPPESLLEPRMADRSEDDADANKRSTRERVSRLIWRSGVSGEWRARGVDQAGLARRGVAAPGRFQVVRLRDGVRRLVLRHGIGRGKRAANGHLVRALRACTLSFAKTVS